MKHHAASLALLALWTTGCFDIGLLDAEVPFRPSTRTEPAAGCTQPQLESARVFRSRGVLGASLSLRFFEDVDVFDLPELRVTDFSVSSDSVAARSPVVQVLGQGYRPIPLNSTAGLPDGRLYLSGEFGPERSVSSLREDGLDVRLSWQEMGAPLDCRARFKLVPAR